MDEFFEGLASKLRVSGMVADSIMLGIVNSRMEEAYKKVCSKEGGAEQLNEKSRFCELAVMQLDWCMKFIQEQMDNHMAGTSKEHEDLAADLMETRERIQGRLEETELAIKEKDKELDQIAENELKLRQALELREDELRTLTSAFELEKVKCERVWEFIQHNDFDKDNDVREDFAELRNSVEQQFCRLKQKLEDVEVNIIKRMKQISLNTDLKKLVPELGLEGANSSVIDVDDRIGTTPTEGLSGYDKHAICEDKKGRESRFPYSFSESELTVEFEMVGRDIEILKDMLELAFGMMDSAIGSYKAELVEQSWRWMVEQEIVGIVTKNLLYTIRKNYKTKQCSRCPKFATDWFSLVHKMKDFHYDLEFLVDRNISKAENSFDGLEGPSSKLDFGLPLKFSSQISSQDEGAGVTRLERRGWSDSSVMYEHLCHTNHSSEEDRLGHASHHVAEMVRNHESIIRKKTAEVQPLKCDVIREKRSTVLKSDKNFNSVKKKISEIVLKSEHIIEQSDSLAARVKFFKHDEGIPDTEDMQIVSLGGFKDSETYEIESCIREQIYLAILVETVKGLQSLVQIKENLGDNVAFVGNWEAGSIMDSDQSFQKLDEQNRDEADSVVTRNSFVAKIMPDKFFLRQTSSNMESNLQSGSSYCEEEKKHSLCLHNGETEMQLQNEGIESFIREQVNKEVFAETVKSIRLAIETSNEINKNITFHVESEKGSMLDVCKSSHLTEHSMDDEGVSVEVGNTSSDVCSGMHKDLQTTDGNCEENHVQSTSVEGKSLEEQHASFSHNKQEELNINEFVVKPVMEFMKKVEEFEHIVEEKISCNIMRLGEIIYQLSSLVADVISLKKRELLYRRGFLRRCYDLQTAEAEVDLLGDEVDLLLGLLRRTYLVLDHCSPSLQHHTGVSNVLNLLKQELVEDQLLP